MDFIFSSQLLITIQFCTKLKCDTCSYHGTENIREGATCQSSYELINVVYGKGGNIVLKRTVWEERKYFQIIKNVLLLIISLLTLSMWVGLNSPLILTQNVVRWIGLVLRFITIYNTCMLI